MTLGGTVESRVEVGAGTGLPRAVMAADGRGFVAWSNGAANAVVVSPDGAFGPTTTLSPPGITVAGVLTVSTTVIAADAAGDAILAWDGNDGTRQVGLRFFDGAGPQLGSLSVPDSATAGIAAAFSVAPFDVVSNVPSVRWAFGDGTSAEGAVAAHAYATPGNYAVVVTATDAVGNATSATRAISVTAAPLPPAPPAPLPPAPSEPSAPPAPTAPPSPPAVKKCKVPKLKGLTPARAKRKLAAAGCRIGRTTRPKRLRQAKGLVVVRQSRKAGTVVKAGTKVDVALDRKAKKMTKQRKGTRPAK